MTARPLLDRLLAAVAAVPPAILNGLTSRRGYRRERGIPYGALARQKYDLYRPEPGRAGAPLLVFFYGGGWQSGDRGLYRFVGQAFAARGIAVAIPDYRLHPEVVFPAFVEDAAAAVVEAARRTAGPGGPRPLFLAGHSAGAQIAMLLALHRRYLARSGDAAMKVAGAIGISGPYDFLPLREARYKAIFPEPVRAASQPIAFARGDAPPLLLLTGEADTTVSPGNTTRLAARVTEKGGTVAVRTYPGIGHLATIAALAEVLPGRKPPVRDDILAFIGRQWSG